jgi:hypothetical protein
VPRTGLRRQTAYDLLKALDVSTHPVNMSVLATVLDGLPLEAKADLVQFLGGASLRPGQAEALEAVQKLEGYLALPPFYNGCLDTIKKALT